MLSLANNFSNLGFNVNVFPDHYFSGKKNFKVTNFTLPKIIRPQAKKLLLKLKGNQEDLILCDTWKSIRAIPDNFKNIVVFAHGQEYLDINKNKLRIEKSLSKVKFLVASSNYTLNLIKKNWDVSFLSSKVIYPTYHLSKSSFNKQISKDRNKIRFVSICRIEKRKGLLESMNALKIIFSRGYDFSWDIIGDGPYIGILKNECSNLKLASKVVFHGKINNDHSRDKILRNSDVFIMPSFQDKFSIEGFGLSYIEAARYGIPSIAGKSGGAPEAVIHKETGWCVSALNQEDLINTIIESITNYNQRINYGEKALKKFNSEFAGNKVTNQLIDFVKQI
tara:strand:+ start:1147 stop:2154 length:1008 start_codon:yes stop_codon:yes gene_type:complete